MSQEIIEGFKQTEADLPDCVRIDYNTRDLGFERFWENRPPEGTPGVVIMPKWDRYFLVGGPSRNGDHQHGIRRPALDAWPEMDAFLSRFPGEVARALVGILPADGGINAHKDGLELHTDAPLGGYGHFVKCARFHVPLKVDPESRFFVNDRIYHFDEGELWFFRNMKAHGASNWRGETARAHLVFDVLPTPETLELIATGQAVEGCTDPDTIRHYWPRDPFHGYSPEAQPA